MIISGSSTWQQLLLGCILELSISTETIVLKSWEIKIFKKMQKKKILLHKLFNYSKLKYCISSSPQVSKAIHLFELGNDRDNMFWSRGIKSYLRCCWHLTVTHELSLDIRALTHWLQEYWTPRDRSLLCKNDKLKFGGGHKLVSREALARFALLLLV